jgi:hypothetical protein
MLATLVTREMFKVAEITLRWLNEYTMSLVDARSIAKLLHRCAIARLKIKMNPASERGRGRGTEKNRRQLTTVH